MIKLLKNSFFKIKFKILKLILDFQILKFKVLMMLFFTKTY